MGSNDVKQKENINVKDVKKENKKDKKKEKKKTDEFIESLQRISQATEFMRDMPYFMELALRYKSMNLYAGKKPNVIMIDVNFPEEVIEALNARAIYIIGGSFKSAVEAENMVPRDTDSVTKSILGLLTDKRYSFLKNAVLLIPINNDSMRKISYMLKDDFKVIPVEVPSDKNNKVLTNRWKNEVERVTHRLERHLGTLCTKSKLKRAIETIRYARASYQRLEESYLRYSGIVDGSTLMFVANSYLWDRSKASWASNVDKMANDIEVLGKRFASKRGEKPQVLLMGSPIYFPNYKIPFLLEELGMEIVSNITPINSMLKRGVVDYTSNDSNLLSRVADCTMQHDIAPAYVNNISLFRKVKDIADNIKLNGVVYHVLKGQIEYDFELKYIETYLEEKNIPVFRLETDYNYQDVEQLRIRLEAFCEMITQKMIVEKRSA